MHTCMNTNVRYTYYTYTYICIHICRFRRGSIFHQTYILQRTIRKAMHTVMITFSKSHLTDGTAIYNFTTSKRLSFNDLYANTSIKSCRIRLFFVLRVFIKDKPQQEEQETMRWKDTEFAAVGHKHKHAHTHTWPESRESCKEFTQQAC